jgi:hypothetical protein
MQAKPKEKSGKRNIKKEEKGSKRKNFREKKN